MASILKSLRLLSDPARLRIVLLLEREELSVAELQEVLTTGQSTISTQLAQLKNVGLVEDRRTGKSVLYRLKDGDGQLAGLLEVARRAVSEIPETAQDRLALELVLRKRQDRVRAYFDELAGKFGRQYVPGRSWRGLAEAFLALMPPMVVADLGAGEGAFAQLMARRARSVIAIDDSEEMVRYGTELAARHGVKNLQYRRGDMEDLPIEDSAVEVAFFSQSLHHARHPRRAVAEAYRILRAGGRIAVLDLKKHHLEEARDLYADLWLGFAEVELQSFLDGAGFRNIEIASVHRETGAPHFETLLAVGEK